MATLRALATRLLFALIISIPATIAHAEDAPTPEEYVAHVGGDASIIPYGKFVLDGRRQICGRRPIVLDDNLDDYGAAYPGFLIMNPKLLSRVSSSVKHWIFAHECAHQFRGPDELTADCFAVQRGRRYGWLSPSGVEEVCKFISPAKADMMHLSGSQRCQAMRKCYSESRVH